MATGMKSVLKPEYAKSLKDRDVTLYPDIGAYDEWKERSKSFTHCRSISVSRLLETNADVQAFKNGYDLADYLVQYSVTIFQ